MKFLKKKQGGNLCSNSWFHCYNHPLLAVLLNPIHANIDNPRLFEIEVEGESKEDNGLKFGFTKMRLVKEIDLPTITEEQKIKFAIYCALEVYSDESFVKWGQDWLSGKDKSAEAAARVAWAAWAAAEVSWAAEAAWAAWAAAEAAEDAEAAAWAAEAAAWAAASEIDLIAIAELACKE